MDGTTLDSLLVPELGQTEQEEQHTAPEESANEEGQVAEAAPNESVDDGQGEEQAITEKLIPESQYKELQRAFTQKSMELANLKRQAPEPPQLQPIPQQARETPNDLQSYIQYQVQEMLEATIAPIQQQQQDLQVQSQVMKLADAYNDFEEIAPAFVELLEESPEFFDIPSGIEKAFKLARADYIEREGAARAKAAVAASKVVTAQKVAVTDTTPISKQQGNQQSEADLIKQSIFSAGRQHSSIFG